MTEIVRYSLTMPFPARGPYRNHPGAYSYVGPIPKPETVAMQRYQAARNDRRIAFV